MIRYNKRYPVEDVLPYTQFENKAPRVKIDGDYIKMQSQRYQLFYRDGCRCVVCGIEGTLFFKEKSNPEYPYHFNLYAEKNGEYILMTKDHIKPISRGGKNHMSNYQVMCSVCNTKKGNTKERK